MSRLSGKRKAVTIDKKLLKWAEEQIRKGKFKNFNHVVEEALEKLKDVE